MSACRTKIYGFLCLTVKAVTSSGLSTRTALNKALPHSKSNWTALRSVPASPHPLQLFHESIALTQKPSWFRFLLQPFSLSTWQKICRHLWFIRIMELKRYFWGHYATNRDWKSLPSDGCLVACSVKWVCSLQICFNRRVAMWTTKGQAEQLSGNFIDILQVNPKSVWKWRASRENPL